MRGRLGLRMWAEKKQKSIRRERLELVEGVPMEHPWFCTLTPVLYTGRWACTSGCCAPTLAVTWTLVSPHLCGHQLSEPHSATAAATGAPCAVFGEETELAPEGPLSRVFPRAEDWLLHQNRLLKHRNHVSSLSSLPTGIGHGFQGRKLSDNDTLSPFILF